MKYFSPETKRAKKIAAFIKGICATLGCAAFFQDKPYWTIGILIVGAVADETIKFLSDDQDKDTLI